MRERPIIFNADMIRAVLDGSKTQTRWVIKNQHVTPYWSIKPAKKPRHPGHTHDWWLPMSSQPHSPLPACPFGAVGDRLWVRETCQAVEHESGLDVVLYPADGNEIPVKAHPLEAGLWVDLYRYRGGEGKIVPSIHMPRWASRITLEITGVRVERLSAISDADERFEGCPCQLPDNPDDERPARTWFRGLWSEIYGEQNWQANPWVWVVEFKRVEDDQ